MYLEVFLAFSISLATRMWDSNVVLMIGWWSWWGLFYTSWSLTFLTMKIWQGGSQIKMVTLASAPFMVLWEDHLLLLSLEEAFWRWQFHIGFPFFFFWTVAWGKIFTSDNLRKRGFIIVDWCCMCQSSGEDVDWLLIHC